MLPRLLSAARHPAAVRLMHAGYAGLERLPYKQIICLDTEFRAVGDPHRGWCLCGIELRSGAEYRLWLDGYEGPPPFPTGADTLIVAFVAGAEIATFRARGWSMPARIFDLFQEMRLVTNTGDKYRDPTGLESGCAHYGISTTEHATKKGKQTEAQVRTLWSADQRRDLIEYCHQDALATARLFLCVLAQWLETHTGHEERALHHALRRGLFAGALAEAELRGIPLDPHDWRDLQDSRETIFAAMVDELPPELRTIYRNTKAGPVFTVDAFESAMDERELAATWPRTRTGHLSTTKDVLREIMAPVPELRDLAEVMGIRSRFALLQCEVGSDGRARCPFFPGSTATGRCAPNSNRFIYAAPRLFRHLIQARPGRVVIQLDYAAQESALAGALAGDDALLAAYAAGDVHLEAAKRCGLAPHDATSKTHPEARRTFKICNLAVVYGARVHRIAAQLGVSEGAARSFFDVHRREFHRTHEFCDRVIQTAEVYRLTVLQDGWRKIVPAPFRPTTAANFPIQGTAACILRHAVLGFYGAGLPLLAPVHDAAVFEVALADAESLIRTAARIMVDAGRWFLPGLTLKVDVAASIPLPHLSHLTIGDLASKDTLSAYRGHLTRARKAIAA